MSCDRRHSTPGLLAEVVSAYDDPHDYADWVIDVWRMGEYIKHTRRAGVNDLLSAVRGLERRISEMADELLGKDQ